MEAPMAALAVARMIAIAATSTRSEREIASLVFLDMWLLLFRLVDIAWSWRLGLFRVCLSRAPSAFNAHLLFQSGCFDFRVILKKFRTVPSTWWAAFALQKTNRQTNFYVKVTERH